MASTSADHPRDHDHAPRLGRRPLAAGLLASLVLGGVRVAFAEGRGDGRKFVLVILRGAMDGLAAVPPVGDRDYAAIRGALAVREGALELGNGFALHPSLSGLHGLYRENQLLVVHAVASPYRQRSHFDGQAMLELGTARVGGTDGWLNRALSAMGATAPPAMAVGTGVPLVLSGSRGVMNWQAGAAPSSRIAPLAGAVAHLWEGHPLLEPALAEGVRTGGLVTDTLGRGRVGGAFADACKAAGQLMAAPGGPGVVVLELGGWDTHVGQGTDRGRIATSLTQLDAGIMALRGALGGAWDRTVACAVTEFGRTVRPNGTGGTDHGTAGAAFVAGGAVAGGRLLADWPGLSPGALLDDRDLRPTLDLRAIFRSVLSDHLGIASAGLARIFPDADGLRPVQGLVRA